MQNDLEHAFPNLQGTVYSITSPDTPAYNCVAWAADETHRCWWPTASYYWPPETPRETTLMSFIKAFQRLGYEPCTDANLEVGFEKVAIYVDSSGTPSHMARQLASGVWTSKLGHDRDISHQDLVALEGLVYGKPAQVLRRPKDSAST